MNTQVFCHLWKTKTKIKTDEFIFLLLAGIYNINKNKTLTQALK